MNNNFDELAKGLAQSTTRRQVLKKLGVGLMTALSASLGICDSSAARRKPAPGYCQVGVDGNYTGACLASSACQAGTSPVCSGSPGKRRNLIEACWSGFLIDTSAPCSF